MSGWDLPLGRLVIKTLTNKNHKNYYFLLPDHDEIFRHRDEIFQRFSPIGVLLDNCVSARIPPKVDAIVIHVVQGVSAFDFFLVHTLRISRLPNRFVQNGKMGGRQLVDRGKR